MAIIERGKRTTGKAKIRIVSTSKHSNGFKIVRKERDTRDRSRWVMHRSSLDIGINLRNLGVRDVGPRTNTIETDRPCERTMETRKERPERPVPLQPVLAGGFPEIDKCRSLEVWGAQTRS
jgi:hypothetical protein